MTSLYTIMAILATVALIGSIGATSLQQQASAVCTFTESAVKQFKSLTKDFKKDVLDAVIVDPGLIPGLLQQYSRDVLNLC